VTIAKQIGTDDAVSAKQLAALERRRQIDAMLLEHLDGQVWVKLLDRAQAAATQGESSFELIRFPCDLCSDGGRKIDVAEIDWPSTLRGEAAEVLSRLRLAKPSSKTSLLARTCGNGDAYLLPTAGGPLSSPQRSSIRTDCRPATRRWRL
jgi:hypothetical protein